MKVYLAFGWESLQSLTFSQLFSQYQKRPKMYHNYPRRRKGERVSRKHTSRFKRRMFFFQISTTLYLLALKTRCFFCKYFTFTRLVARTAIRNETRSTH